MIHQCFAKLRKSTLVVTTLFYILFYILPGLPAIAQDDRDVGRNRVQQKFNEIDTDSDGVISQLEMQNHEAGKGKSDSKRFGQTDSNGDGEISFDEFIHHENSKQRGDNKRQSPGQDGNSSKTIPAINDSPFGSNKYSISQAISDRAQLNTIAFSGLAFLTGDFGAATFIPPGKVCDFFGFQYMRDIDAAEKGHNPMFLNRVAGNVLHILNDDQKQKFVDLAIIQAPQLEELANMRLDMIKAFHMQRDNQIPSGSSRLNEDAVVQQISRIFERDAELSLRRAEVMADVANSLTPEQKSYLSKMEFGNFNTWPAIDERGKLKKGTKGQSKLVNVAYMTYASEFFSWIKGSVEADVYFCPERHGTYFGGFYMKDMPAMGKRDYDISTSVTGDSGEAFLGILTLDQRRLVTQIPDLQAKDLQQIIEVRRAVSQELRKYLSGQTPDRNRVLELGKTYGELDGKMSYLYALAFSDINKTLKQKQRNQLNELRNLDGYNSAAYYIYSRPVNTSPPLENVNHFFFQP